MQAAAPSIDPMKWEQEEVERENLKVRSSFQSLFSPVLEGIRTIRVTDWKMRISWLEEDGKERMNDRCAAR